MLKLNIEVTATNWEEFEYALQEVQKKIGMQNVSGADEREDGITAYNFSVSGEESKSVECKNPDCNSINYWEDELPNTCWSCGKDL